MSTPAPTELSVDDLDLEVRWSSRRKTLGLTVDRGGELIVAAPEGVDVSVLEAFVREKKFWIYTKLAVKNVLRHPSRETEFVTGEGFAYLGRSYRLLLVDEQDEPLKLHRGRFRLLRSTRAAGREHFVEWYRSRGHAWLGRRLGRWTHRLGAQPSDLEVLDLGNRWGSCSSRGRLNVHWATMQLAVPLVDYVLVHELVHLHEPHHTPEFWRRVERAMPDFARRKDELARVGGRMWLP